MCLQSSSCKSDGHFVDATVSFRCLCVRFFRVFGDAAFWIMRLYSSIQSIFLYHIIFYVSASNIDTIPNVQPIFSCFGWICLNSIQWIRQTIISRRVISPLKVHQNGYRWMLSFFSISREEQVCQASLVEAFYLA